MKLVVRVATRLPPEFELNATSTPCVFSTLCVRRVLLESTGGRGAGGTVGDGDEVVTAKLQPPSIAPSSPL